MDSAAKRARVWEPPCSNDTQPPPSMLSSLPHVVVDAIFRFTVKLKDPIQPLTSGDITMPRPFSSIALVSKAWLAIATQVHSECELEGAFISDMSFRREKIRQRQQLTLRRAFLTRLEMMPSGYNVQGRALRFTTDTLSCVPRLEELNLTRMQCSAKELSQIVRMAARHSPAIRKLALPPLICKPEDYAQVVFAVFEAAHEWRKNKFGGLRYLRLPMHGMLADSKASDAYVDEIIKCCPMIEQIEDGRYDADDANGTSNGDETMWRVSLETWTRFCQTCSHLRTFKMRTLPFATRFFKVFGEHVKPNLTSLTLGTVFAWNWTTYLSQADPTTANALSTDGYASTATNLHSVLAACPRLASLTISIHAVKGIDQIQLLEPAAVYDDVFWKALAQGCRQLEKLEVRQSLRDTNNVIAITDGAMQGLARLSELRSVSLDYVTISGGAVFDLVVNHAADSRHERIFSIKLGIAHEDMLFYTVLEDFLTRLAQYDSDTLPCATRRVVLRLDCDNREVDRQWSVGYLDRLRELAKQGRAKYPDVLMRGVVNDFHSYEKCFFSIERFTFATQPKPQDKEDTDHVTPERIDDVFVNQSWASDLRNDREQEYDDDYGEYGIDDDDAMYDEFFEGADHLPDFSTFRRRRY